MDLTHKQKEYEFSTSCGTQFLKNYSRGVLEIPLCHLVLSISSATMPCCLLVDLSAALPGLHVLLGAI